MSQFDFKGIFTALVTPFDGEKVDHSSYEKLVDFQIEKGIEGLVVNGTTGESPTLSKSEVKELFEITKGKVEGRVPIMVGTGSNDTRKTIEMTQEAARWGADMALVVVPYYNKPPQAGMIRHFQAVADNSDIPIMLYNVPGRTVVSMDDETVEQLGHHEKILGIKEASGDPNRANKLRSMCGPDFVLLSGDDASCVEFMLQGGDGVISVISHVIPKELVEIAKCARNREAAAVEQYSAYEELNRVLCLDSNPIPVKKAMQLMGVVAKADVRSPLVELDEEKTGQLRSVLADLSLVKD